jgi:hypothetical protein
MLILFPNRQAMLRKRNIRYQQASIRPGEPVLSPHYHWEVPRINLYGSVFRSEKGYEMFYQCGNALRVGHAVSEDGESWQRPLVNVTDFSAPASQIVLNEYACSLANHVYAGDAVDARFEITNVVAGCHMPSVIYEPAAVHPYKIFAFGEGGFRAMYSTNGLQFYDYPENPVIPLKTYHNPETDKNWVSDVAPCYLDNDRYHAMVKTYALDEQNRTRRCIGHAQSDDFVHWSEVTTLWKPGAEEDAIARSRGFQWADFYGLCPFRYGDGFLGFLWLFEIEKELPRGTNLGKIEVFLAHSEDGVSWKRLADQPLIPWDLNFGEDGGMVTTPSAPVFDEDGIKLYYSDSNYEHGFTEKDFTKELDAPIWVVRCAHLPKERLVGASSDDGCLSFVLSAKGLEGIRLNLDCCDGELRLMIESAQHPVAEITLSGIDETDWYWALDDHLAEHALQIDTLVATVFLKKATLYAIEVISCG